MSDFQPVPQPTRKVSLLKALIVGMILAFLVAGGAYAFFVSKKQAAPQNLAPSPDSSNAPAATTTPPAMSGKVRAVIAVQPNYQGNPLRVLVTCTADTGLDIYGMTFYPGDGSVVYSQSNGPVPKIKTFDRTYNAPGNYDLVCVPLYGDSGEKISQDSPYAVKQTITLAGSAPLPPPAAAPSGSGLAFTFQPRTGSMPLQVQADCSVTAAGKVVSISIGVDHPQQFAPDQTIDDKFLAFNADTANGVAKTISAKSVLDNHFWKGTHDVYCAAAIEGHGQPLISDPIRVNFQ